MLPSFSMAPVAITFTSLSSVLAGAYVTNSSCSSSPSIPVKPVEPIPISALPTAYSVASRTQAADSIAQILNTLSLYPLAIDGKDFGALSLVFTADVYTNFSAPLNVLTPLTVVQAGISQALAFVDTQHLYGTQIVDIQNDCQARSVSYFTATHFGRGRYFGQVRELLHSDSPPTYPSHACLKHVLSRSPSRVHSSISCNGSTCEKLTFLGGLCIWAVSGWLRHLLHWTTPSSPAQDTLIKLPNNEWRIQTRNLVYMVRAQPVAASGDDTCRLTRPTG